MEGTPMTTAVDAGTYGKLWDMIRDVRVAMLTSRDGPVLRSRPMVAVQDRFEGQLFFFTRAASHKVDEVQQDEEVNLSYADPKSENYVSLSGTATLVRDPDLIRSLWRESLRVWFPKGQGDPDIAVLRIDVSQAEYWDAPSSTMLHLWGYAKAVTTGQPPQPGGHARVNLS
ncbi:MAG: pyridoxamine 5'-phosphate oxidase family protein [Acidisphaera sp.]|nr:pyridoxamine 5'-phosphate oxidase family protein [Acidisphaera sp.]